MLRMVTAATGQVRAIFGGGGSSNSGGQYIISATSDSSGIVGNIGDDATTSVRTPLMASSVSGEVGEANENNCTCHHSQSPPVSSCMTCTIANGMHIPRDDALEVSSDSADDRRNTPSPYVSTNVQHDGELLQQQIPLQFHDTPADVTYQMASMPMSTSSASQLVLPCVAQSTHRLAGSSSTPDRDSSTMQHHDSSTMLTDAGTSPTGMAVCRFCLEEMSPAEHGRLQDSTPACYCTGSSRYVHTTCLARWVATKLYHSPDISSRQLRRFLEQPLQQPVGHSPHQQSPRPAVDVESCNNEVAAAMIPRAVLACEVCKKDITLSNDLLQEVRRSLSGMVTGGGGVASNRYSRRAVIEGLVDLFILAMYVAVWMLGYVMWCLAPKLIDSAHPDEATPLALKLTYAYMTPVILVTWTCAILLFANMTCVWAYNRRIQLAS